VLHAKQTHQYDNCNNYDYICTKENRIVKDSEIQIARKPRQKKQHNWLQKGKNNDKVLLNFRRRKIPLLSLGWFTLIPPEAERTVIEEWLSIYRGIEIN
jgi:hypothetical protein